jgi:hypothetical protein
VHCRGGIEQKIPKYIYIIKIYIKYKKKKNCQPYQVPTWLITRAMDMILRTHGPARMEIKTTRDTFGSIMGHTGS